MQANRVRMIAALSSNDAQYLLQPWKRLTQLDLNFLFTSVYKQFIYEPLLINGKECGNSSWW